MASSYGIKYEKAVECLSKDREPLLAFYDFPAEYWKHLRTTNPIERFFSGPSGFRRRRRGLFRPSSSCISVVAVFLPVPRIRDALLDSRVTRFTQRTW
jgi:transposase-like protein